MSDQRIEDFEKAAKRSGGNQFSEIWHLLKQNKKWWLLPILVFLIFMGLLMVLSSTAAAPFIYTLF